MVKDRLLAEAKDAISGGNKAATAILVGLIVWWWVAINPFPFSGLDAPLDKIRSIRADQALLVNECGRFDDGERTARRRLVVDCLSMETAAAYDFSFDQLLAKVKGSSTLPSNCDWEKISERVKEQRSKCDDALKTLKATLKEVRDGTELEVLSIKFKRVHPILHPLIYFLLLLAGAIWLGSRRRLVFGLLVECLNSGAPDVSNSDVPPNIFFSLPWWLWPLPKQLKIGERIARAKDIAKARNSALFVGLLVLVGAWGAFVVQKTLSAPFFSGERFVAGLELSITGNYLADLSILGILLSLTFLLYIGFLPNEQLAYNAAGDGPDLFRRASLLGAGAIVGAIAAPLVADRRTTSKVVVSGLDARILIKPRRKRRARVAKAQMAGWFVADRATRPPVAHYANQSKVFVRYNVWPPKRKRRPKPKAGKAKLSVVRQWFRASRAMEQTLSRPTGIIKGAGSLVNSLLRQVDFEQIKTRKVKFNKNFYSNGVEDTTIELWKRDKAQAIAALRVGIIEVNKRQTRRLNLRLYDLSAGLLARSGETNELQNLATELEALKVGRQQGTRRARILAKNADIDNKRVDQRLEAWRNPNSLWLKRWQASKVKWNGVEL